MKGGVWCHLTLFLHRMDQSRAACFSQEEHAVITERYEEYKYIITARSNTVAANKVRDECWQKTADRVNLLIKTLIH